MYSSCFHLYMFKTGFLFDLFNQTKVQSRTTLKKLRESNTGSVVPIAMLPWKRPRWSFGRVRPHRHRGGMGVIKEDWLFTPPLYHRTFNCFLFSLEKEVTTLSFTLSLHHKALFFSLKKGKKGKGKKSYRLFKKGNEPVYHVRDMIQPSSIVTREN